MITESNRVDLNALMPVNPRQYTESHPAVFVPKHSYKKYRMQNSQIDRESDSVFKQIGKRTIDPLRFGICNLIKNHNYKIPRVRN